VLNHVRAEEVTVRQCINWRDEGQKKDSERSYEIDWPASLSEDDEVTDAAKRGSG